MKLRQNKFLSIIILTLSVFIFKGCGIYSFTGASIPPGVTTFQVNFFENQAGNRPGSTVEPGLDNEFTNALQDLIMNQTNLDLVTSDGQLIYEGEITEYSVTPMSATAQITAAQNRLKMSVAFRFINTKLEEDDFSKTYSFFYDFPAELQVFDVKNAAHEEIFDRITQDIFNDTLAKW
ncbi:LPS assembly lipoprotein LptE [Flavobacteriaceae bacterium]|nr:LPS assembly lipoprotein LptE [Flavobacteriaceae bacterium]MDA9015418.1 LPS assembly lipoprotein LptE [Flavobacteriaceae bacterium]MDA9572212.1 LPS assembly lipoprotein LptE [Flavobacteriaceae bacterium]MDB3863105.1 LPS assembly lipoprotein LptE [Flavobacteriaceae bacterium]MDC3354043.1 LPS assembly lipoprotein LptE [Flavobacteriaceae bacterium]